MLLGGRRYADRWTILRHRAESGKQVESDQLKFVHWVQRRTGTGLFPSGAAIFAQAPG
jgi:hypothetical protein